MAKISRTCHATLARLQSLGTPAATVCLLRGGPNGPECLLLRKNRNIRFGGLWVFPGGKMDSTDHSSSGVLSTAANAAIRETREECGIDGIDTQRLLFISHWVPPTSEVGKRGKRFSTFFFVAPLPAGAADVSVDGSEIASSTWLRPGDALERHASGQLGLLPPTWMTLDTLLSAVQRSDGTVNGVMAVLRQDPALAYETRSGDAGNGRTAFMWQGDAGWPTGDPSVPGARLRLTSTPAAGGEVGSLASGAATLILERGIGSAPSRL